jgi:hypothetical protein
MRTGRGAKVALSLVFTTGRGLIFILSRMSFFGCGPFFVDGAFVSDGKG